MYQSFYNLKVKPFQITTDPKFLWLGEKHKEALATLKYGIMENKGFVLSGRIMLRVNKQPVSNALVSLTLIDTIASLDYCYTDPEGKFYFLLNDFYDNKDLILQLEDQYETESEIIWEFDNNNRDSINTNFITFLIDAYSK